jgi:dihydrofolate reductase
MWNLATLDGAFEGPGHDLSWHLDVWGDELERIGIEQGRNAGGLLFGRVTYELMAHHWPKETGPIADFMNTLPKFVFSRTLTKADWNNTRLFSADAPATVARLKRETDKDILVFGSADLATHLIPHGLFDEFRVVVTPHIMSGGTPLFRHAGERLKLDFLDAKPLSSGAVILRYQPAK